MPYMLLGGEYEPTVQRRGASRLNGESNRGKNAVQESPDKIIHTSFSRKDLAYPVDNPPPIGASATAEVSSSQIAVKAQSGSTPPNNPVSILAIISRYHDDLHWLIDPNTGVMNNSTGTPHFVLPVQIYQAADIDPKGFPMFPGLLPPPPANITAQNLTESELIAMNYSAHGPPQLFPTWPEWAWKWAFEKNKTKELVRPGSLEEAEYLARKRLGLPQDGVGPSDYQGWRDYENLFDEKYITSKSEKSENMKNSLLSSTHEEDDLGPLLEELGVDSSMIELYKQNQQDLQILKEVSQKFRAQNRSQIVIIPDISPVLPLNIMPNRGGESMAYLSGIIDNYDNLPDFMLFMHGHRFAWHTPLLSQDWILRRLATHPPLDLNLTSTNGYHALGCLERWGNDISQLFPSCIDCSWRSNNGPRWHETLAARFSQAWREHLGEAYNMPLPDYIRVPTAATFIATREAIQRRPKEFYIGVREWMLNTTIENKWLGIVMEFQIGIVFANKTHFSVSQEQCLCEVYSVCTLPAEL